MNKQVLGLMQLLGAVLCGVRLAIAGAANAGSGQANRTDGTPMLIPLEYREAGFSVDRQWIELRVATAAETAKFKVPPVDKGTRLSFGAIEVGTNRFSFAWDRSKDRLYLDLNQNLDLTDDTAGVFDAADKSYYQKFTNIRLSVSDGAGCCSHLIDLWLYDTRSAFLELRSFYDGKIELAGQTWQIGVVKRPVASDRSARGRPDAALLIRPWVERTKEFSLTDSTAVAVPFCEIVHLWDRSYRPEFVWQQSDGTNKPALKLSPVETELGWLELAGLYVHRLVMEKEPERAAFFHSPTRNIRLPVGTYADIEVFLKNGSSEATAAFDERVVVTANATNTLLVGVR